MQSQMETGFEKRILFLTASQLASLLFASSGNWQPRQDFVCGWSQTYSKALKKGDEYGVLPKIYSI